MLVIITLLIALGAAAFVIIPLIQHRPVSGRETPESEKKLSSLLHRKSVLQETIDDLKFDFETGKLSSADYEALIAEQKKSQKSLDAQIRDLGVRPDAELASALEEEIAAVRMKRQDSPLTCPKCNAAVVKGDKFCAHCGAALS